MSQLNNEELKVYQSLEPYNQFTSGWVKEVGIKLLLNCHLKLPWLLNGSVGIVYFLCAVRYRCIVHCALGKIPECARREHFAIQLLWAIVRLLVSGVSPIYLVEEFHFLFCCCFSCEDA